MGRDRDKPIAKKTIGVVLFHDFELLDVAGPVEMFGNVPDKLNIIFMAEKAGLIKSAQLLEVKADVDFEHHPHLDILFVPGGIGTRKEVFNTRLISWLSEQAKEVELIISVCTGSALLAKAGVLHHRKATSNKLAFDWAIQHGPKTHWVRKARWVDDGNIITSSGVAAGIDMSLYLIARLFGEKTRDEVIKKTEYILNDDADKDDFA